jgi:protein-tyrosine phosphatase
MATILVVCTGNIRRSPAIAALLRHGTAETSGLAEHGVHVLSAGERAHAGAGADPLVVAGLARLGVPEPEDAGQQLTAALVEEADVILTAERSHRSAVVRLVPAAVQRTFTLRELAALGERLGRGRLTGADAPTRLVQLAELAPHERAGRLVRRPAVDDLADVRRFTDRAVTRLLEEIRGPVETILRLVEPVPTLSLVPREEGREEGTGSAADARGSTTVIRPAG